MAGTSNSYSVGSSDFIITKHLTSDGSLLAARQFGGNGAEGGLGLILDKYGYLTFAGYTSSTVPLMSLFGNYPIFTIKFDVAMSD